jgi:hypothetical protein
MAQSAGREAPAIRGMEKENGRVLETTRTSAPAIPNSDFGQRVKKRCCERPLIPKSGGD